MVFISLVVGVNLLIYLYVSCLFGIDILVLCILRVFNFLIVSGKLLLFILKVI